MKINLITMMSFLALVTMIYQPEAYAAPELYWSCRIKSPNPFSAKPEPIDVKIFSYNIRQGGAPYFLLFSDAPSASGELAFDLTERTKVVRAVSSDRTEGVEILGWTVGAKRDATIRIGKLQGGQLVDAIVATIRCQ